MSRRSDQFRDGQYVVYTNGYKYEIGRIKRITDNGAIVAYHEGETGALTDFDRIFPIQNEYCITQTTLGGNYFVERENDRLDAVKKETGITGDTGGGVTE